MNQEYIQQKLREYGIRPNHTFGQNFLLDDSVFDAIIAAAGVNATDTVLEVGPGIGTLTERLASVAQHVIAVEKDPVFTPLLRRVATRAGNVTFENADILRFNLQAFVAPMQYRVVANVPYYITGKIVQLFLQSKTPPQSLTLLIQKEVAENMAALPGSMNLLGLSVQLRGQAKIVRIVPPSAFFPAPKVQSAVVHLDIFEQVPYPGLDEALFFRIARACFAGKRKQIHNTLKTNLSLTDMQVGILLEKSGLSPELRPQALGADDFVRLTAAYRSV